MGTIDARLLVGRKVRIKKYKERPDYWVPAMNKFMGKCVTVKEIKTKPNLARYIKINEDQKDVKGGWEWSPFNFEEI